MTLSLAVILVLTVVALYFLGRTTVLTALICMAAGVALAPTPMGPVLLMVPRALITALGAGFSAVF
ncbi:hypothetical protein [Cryptosporangium aurantiacum]|uniref:Uncharacterized protein n=1 Tax=Cryptosporangium aurantiacum TaxID=134849 RepID=A0A1M7RJK9_9ACTN|nr:hypothetical protein [Cryptosporangium aurantiacum]SHN46454.1 hypothetical protein SAMN05443668_115143 [Cryptosporangium aurantiacum]